LEISIIGLPKSGKTTIYNALTRDKANTETYSTASITPNIGVSKVPEPRLEFLEKVFQPKKTTLTEIKYTDIAGIGKGFGKDEGISGKLLNYLGTADALIHVVRAFSSDLVPHVEGSIDIKRDMTTMDLELSFSDLAIIEKRIAKIDETLKGAKAAERDIHLKEQNLLKKIKEGLNNDTPIWQQGLSDEELRNLSNYQFLTAKPMLVIINIGEDQIESSSALESELRSAYPHPKLEVVALCGKLEMELSQLDDSEADEFRSAMGLTDSALNHIIRASYQLLGLISFFTTVSSELKVWTIPGQTTALKAAGKIHTDIEKGFIKAEVISYHDLEKCGSVAEARKQGLLRLEGKNYIVQDGDIITFLFNV
jgi:GTP-binding protein YchF